MEALEANKTIMRRIFEDLWNRGNLSVADEIFAQPESLKHYVTTFLATFSDLQHSVEEMIAEGDKVAAHWTARGTHAGPWYDTPPTNKRVEFRGVTTVRVVDDRIVAHRTLWDTALLLEQLNSIPKFRKRDVGRL